MSDSLQRQLYLFAGKGQSDLVDQLAHPLPSVASRRAAAPQDARLAIVASAEELGAVLRQARLAVSRGEALDGRDGVYYQPKPLGPGSVAFLFPGQGSQHVGMLSGLRRCFPAFEDRLRALAAVADGCFAASLEEMIFGAATHAGNALRSDTRWAQASLGLVCSALAEALEEVGVSASLVAGHSYGELVALRHAGAMNVSTLFELTRERGQLMCAEPSRAATGMLAIASDAESVARMLEQSGTTAEIANLNTSKQTVVAGPLTELEVIAGLCRESKIRSAHLSATAAFHSSAMQAAGSGFRSILGAFLAAGRLKPPSIPVVANLTAQPYESSPADVVRNLSEQLAGRVRWQESCFRLHALGARLFIETGPGQVLTRTIRENLRGRGCVAEHVDSADAARDQLLRVLAVLASHHAFTPRGDGLGHLFAAGCALSTETEGSTVNSTKGSSLPELMRSSDHIFGRYLDLSGRVLDTLAALPRSQCDASSLTRFLEISSRMTENYLELQDRTFERICRSTPRPDAEIDREVYRSSTFSSNAAPPPAPRTGLMAPASQSERVEVTAVLEPHLNWLLQEVASLTGFPDESIDPDQPMGEFGIDSLAQVSLLERIARRAPGSADGLRRRLRGVRTLRDLAKAIDAGSSGPALLASDREGGEPPSATSETTGEPDPYGAASPAPVRQSANVGSATLASELCAALSDQARIPIDLGTDFDAVAGLTRAAVDETLERLAERHPALRLAGEHARSFSKLDDLIAFVSQLEPARARRDEVVRFVRFNEPRVIPRARLPEDIVIMGPRGPGADRLVECARARGARVDRLIWAGTEFCSDCDAAVRHRTEHELAAWLQTRFARVQSGGIVYVTSSNASHDPACLDAALESDTVGPFYLFKALDWLPQPNIRIGIAALAGDGLTALGARGIARALRKEWGARKSWISALRINDPAARFDGDAALDGLFSVFDQADAVLEGGRHFEEVIARREVTESSLAGELPLGDGDVVLMLGGGGGIATQLAIRLARERRCKIVALGRTPWDGRSPDEATEATCTPSNGASDHAPVRSRAEALAAARRMQLWQARESIRAAGGELTYEAVDACDGVALADAVARCLERHGRIDLVVHAAGLLDDGLLETKSVESFRRVTHAKVRSASALHQALVGVNPKAVLLMSSLVAHTGNAGQTDYCAANEILNSIAEHWAAKVDYRVVSMLWSVWTETGLAQQGVRDLFARNGIRGIETHEGIERTLNELRLASGDPSWVLFASPGVLRYLGASLTDKREDGACPA